MNDANTAAKQVQGGNLYDKYTTGNPAARYLMNNFLTSAHSLIDDIRGEVNSITEVGCGEGHLASFIAEMNIAPVRACDCSCEIIETAQTVNSHETVTYYTKSIYDIGGSERADLMVCCEVLEHLEEPERALDILHETTSRYCLLSVPREPVWRMLNMMRLKYLGDLGNTPGHIQHWSRSGFQRLVSTRFQIIKTRSPFPWTMVLCERKG